jgi:5-dehydro-2-deoxygluconokinase
MPTSCSRKLSRVSDVQLLTIGRVNLDLYSQETGVAFVEAEGWDAMVGGSPSNVALAAARLGVRAGVVTAVGDDLVGDWVLHALRRHGVDTTWVVRKDGPHTSLALRAQLAPDHPLAFYRQDPADIHVTVADTGPAPVEHVDVLLVSADALARGAMREACTDVVRRARAAGIPVFFDLDLRDVNWPDVDTYAATVGGWIESADVLLGTEAEFSALLGAASGDALVGRAQTALCDVAGRVVIVKQGERGATLLTGAERVHVPAFPIEEASTVGAGDSFSAGLIRARLEGRDWVEAIRFGSACAAITVSRFGCSSGFPRLHEVNALIERHHAVMS